MVLKVAIVGRPNVGKSTLFNRFARKKLAIVDDTPGVTRDWRMAEADFYDLPLIVIDTAGLEDDRSETIEGRMRSQTERALDEADVILFVIDGRAGVMPLDEYFASMLRKRKMPVILTVNKCENDHIAQAAVPEAYKLGMGEPLALSAEHGLGFDELYDALEEQVKIYDQDTGEIPDLDELEGDLDDSIFEGDLDELEGNEHFEFEDAAVDEEDEKPIKIAIVGRPNSGKSTLLNVMVGDQRVMTGPEAGITRDAIAVDWEYDGQKFKLVDTAGMRKKAKVHETLERMSVDDSLRAIRLAQVVVLMLDGELLLEKQDLAIAEHVIREGRALVIAINKWDIVKKKKEALEKISDRLMRSLGQLPDVPVVTISALTGKNVQGLMERIMKTYRFWNMRAQTGQMNRWLRAMESHHPAPLVQGKPNRLKYIAQIKTRPPTFALWVSRPKELPQSYRRYIINGIRKDFEVQNVPIRLLVRTSKNPYSD